MPFQKGKSGNPAGRPKGIQDKRVALRALLEPHAEALIEKAVAMALEGDSTALRLCIERLVPAYRAQDPPPAAFDLPAPDLKTASGVVQAAAAVVSGVAAGRLLPDQGRILATLLESQRRLIELADVEARLAVLERRMEEMPR